MIMFLYTLPAITREQSCAEIEVGAHELLSRFDMDRVLSDRKGWIGLLVFIRERCASLQGCGLDLYNSYSLAALNVKLTMPVDASFADAYELSEQEWVEELTHARDAHLYEWMEEWLWKAFRAWKRAGQ